MAPKISLIIPAYNEESYIADCLASIIANVPKNQTEIIVVDNASTDKTQEIAKSFHGIKVYKEEKKGVMYARQRGYMESTGDILVFVDADNIITSDWIGRIEEEFLNNSSVVAISGSYKYYDMNFYQKLLASFYWHIIVRIAYISIGYVGNFGNMAIRRSALEKMGGLDTSIIFYGDDTNTAQRASKFGKVKYDPALVVKSSARRFVKLGLIRTTYIYAINFFSQVLFKKSVSKNNQSFR